MARMGSRSPLLLVGACLLLHARALWGFSAPPIAPASFSARTRLPGASQAAPARFAVPGRIASRAAALRGLRDAECQASGGKVGKRVCVVGGGFGGLFTAMKLANLAPLAPDGSKAEITLIDPRDRFVFLPLLYELVTGEMRDWEVAPVFEDLLQGSGIKFVQGSAVRIDQATREVEVGVAAVAGGGSKVVEYDTLVLAGGAQQKLPADNGAAAHALAFNRAEDAKLLRQRLAAAKAAPRPGKAKASLVIVGGGYAGVELASSLARENAGWATVTLLHRGAQLLPAAQRYSRITAVQELHKAGVNVRTENSVLAVESNSIAVKVRDGESETLAADVIVWTAGSGPSTLPSLGEFPTTKGGRVPVGPKLLVQGCTNVYALGDLAECYDALGDLMPGNAQVAIQQADCVAWNIHASLTRGIPIKFRYQALGEVLTFGRQSSALASPLFGLQVSGLAGWAMRRATYLVRMPGTAHTARVAASWISDLARPPARAGK